MFSLRKRRFQDQSLFEGHFLLPGGFIASGTAPLPRSLKDKVDHKVTVPSSSSTLTIELWTTANHNTQSNVNHALLSSTSVRSVLTFDVMVFNHESITNLRDDGLGLFLTSVALFSSMENRRVQHAFTPNV